MTSQSSGDGITLRPGKVANRRRKVIFTLDFEEIQNDQQSLNGFGVDPIFRKSRANKNRYPRRNSDTPSSKVPRVTTKRGKTATPYGDVSSCDSNTTSSNQDETSDDDDDFFSCASNFPPSIVEDAIPSSQCEVETTRTTSPSSILCETGGATSDTSQSSFKRRQGYASRQADIDKENESEVQSTAPEEGNDETVTCIQNEDPFSTVATLDEERSVTFTSVASSYISAPRHVMLPENEVEDNNSGISEDSSSLERTEESTMLNDNIFRPLERQSTDKLYKEELTSASKQISMTGEVVIRVYQSDFVPNRTSIVNSNPHDHRQQAIHKDDPSDDLKQFSNHSHKTDPTLSVFSGTNNSSATSFPEHDIQHEDDELLLVGPPTRCIRKNKSKSKPNTGNTGSDGDEADEVEGLPVNRGLDVAASIDAVSLASSSTSSTRGNRSQSKSARNSRSSASSSCQDSSHSSHSDSNGSQPELPVLRLTEIDNEHNHNPQPRFRDYGAGPLSVSSSHSDSHDSHPKLPVLRLTAIDNEQNHNPQPRFLDYAARPSPISSTKPSSYLDLEETRRSLDEDESASSSEPKEETERKQGGITLSAFFRKSLQEQSLHLDSELAKRSFDEEDLDISYTEKDESVNDGSISLSSFFRKPEKPKSSSALLMVTRWNEEDQHASQSLNLQLDHSRALFTPSGDDTPNESGPKHSRETKGGDSKDRFSLATCWQCLWNVFQNYEMASLVVVVIFLAKAYPPIGATYVYPRITASWISVVFMFGKYCAGVVSLVWGHDGTLYSS
jgi:hypothetical protein